MIAIATVSCFAVAIRSMHIHIDYIILSYDYNFLTYINRKIHNYSYLAI